MRILVVGADEPDLNALRTALSLRGHEVRQVDGQDAVIDLAPDCEFVVLDLDMPGFDGNETCGCIRRVSRVPIVTLTGSTDEIDRMLGLRLGADDCVVKPFSVTEVVTRIDAVARRCGPTLARHGVTRGLHVGALALDVRARRAMLDGAELHLTRKEFDLLRLLAENAGAVCLREEIIKRVWDENWFGSTRTLDVHVGTLRRKLGRRCRIETVRGVGFRLSDST
jgi:two-component system, OmpR family, response regulator RegX3